MATPRTKKSKAAAKKTAFKASVKAPVKVAVKPPMAEVKPPMAEVKPPVATIKTPTPASAQASDAHVLRKKEFIDRVVERSGIKKKDAKPAIEAALAILGESLAKGEELNLHPLGKVKVNRVIEKPNATIFITKVRRKSETAGDTVVKIATNP